MANLSLPIALTSVRDFFGLTGNINLTNLHRGESNIINVQSTYGSTTVGKGSVVTNANGSIRTASADDYLELNGSVNPFNYYEYGGISPSLSSANTGIQDSGSIDLTDYVNAFRKVTPTVSYVGADPVTAQGQHTGQYRGVSVPDTNPMAYKSWCGINYETLNKNPNIGGFDVPSYCQLLTMSSQQYNTYSVGSMTVNFTLSQKGIYTIFAHVAGGGVPDTNFFNISGTGLSLKTPTGYSLSTNTNIILPNNGVTSATGRLFELTHTDTSATITLVCGGTGANTMIQIRTNTNYLRDHNTTNYTVYNDMMTQSTT